MLRISPLFFASFFSREKKEGMLCSSARSLAVDAGLGDDDIHRDVVGLRG